MPYQKGGGLASYATSLDPGPTRSLTFCSLLLDVEGGPGTRVSLCPGTTFQLTGPVVFTAKDQELSTQGYPTDETRAKLLPMGKTITAVQCVVQSRRPSCGQPAPDP